MSKSKHVYIIQYPCKSEENMIYYVNKHKYIIIFQIAQGCPDLRKINLTLCAFFVTDNGVLAITENCPRLKEVMLGYLPKV